MRANLDRSVAIIRNLELYPFPALVKNDFFFLGNDRSSEFGWEILGFGCNRENVLGWYRKKRAVKRRLEVSILSTYWIVDRD